MIEQQNFPSTVITTQDIFLAKHRIAPITKKTSLIESPLLAEMVDCNVYLKPENLQETGSFKIRGAANKILSLPQDQRNRGVITVSSGNHGRALAYLAKKLNFRAVVVLSETSAEGKRKTIMELGAEAIVQKTYDDAYEYANKLVEEQNLVMVDPFDDPDIIAGQGTIGLEILEELPEISTVIVPLSGGGLLAGIAFVLKSANPSIKLIGVSMERGPAMVESLKAGRIVKIIQEPTLADALAGDLSSPNIYTFKMIQEYVDETILVSEEEIAGAMTFALEKHHLVVEGGAAVGIATLLYRKVKHLGNNVAVVVSGCNVDLPVLLKVAQDHYPYQEAIA